MEDKPKPKKKKPYNPAPVKYSGADYGNKQKGAGVGKFTHRTSTIGRWLTGPRPVPKTRAITGPVNKKK